MIAWYQYLWIPIGLLMGLLPCRLVRRFLPLRTPRLWALGPWLLFFILFSMVTWVADENGLIILPFFLFTFLVCYGGPVLARLVAASIFYPLFISLNMMVDSLGYVFHPMPFSTSQMIKAACWLLLDLLLCWSIPKDRPLRLSTRLWLLTGALSLAPLSAQLGFVLYHTRGLSEGIVYDSVRVYMTRMAYTVLPFVLLSCLALLFALRVLSQYEQMVQQRQIEEINSAYYKQLEQRQAQVRRLRHDMANHLQTLSALPDGERDAYLAQLLDSPALGAPSKWSEHQVVNAVLTAKAEEMAADHIQGDLSAPLPALLPFRDTDLCAMVANSLDNAIEASRKLPQDMRRITLKARVDRGLFVLQVVNPCLEEPVRKNGRLMTSKPDRSRHGLGLESVQAIAEKYGGSCCAGLRGQEFELLLYLPMK